MQYSSKSWIAKRVDAMNRRIARCRNPRAMTEHLLCEFDRLNNTKCKTKKEYKAWISINGNQ
jgi:hypothetical protein